MIKVGIVEDDYGIRDYIAQYINLQEDMTCTTAHVTVESFFEFLEKPIELDVLLLDINLPGKSGIEAIPPIKKIIPNLEIIMLTINGDKKTVLEALSAGATGYLLKNSSLAAIGDAVRSHIDGGSFMSPKVARILLGNLVNHSERRSNNSAPNNKLASLSSREFQVLEALVDGLSYKLIADRLKISTTTVPVHIRNIYRKLQINSKSEAISIYYQDKMSR